MCCNMPHPLLQLTPRTGQVATKAQCLEILNFPEKYMSVEVLKFSVQVEWISPFKWKISWKNVENPKLYNFLKLKILKVLQLAPASPTVFSI